MVVATFQELPDVWMKSEHLLYVLSQQNQEALYNVISTNVSYNNGLAVCNLNKSKNKT